MRSPEKTLIRVQERFAEASIEAAGAAKGGASKDSDLQMVTVDPGRIGVGDLVVLRQVGESGAVLMEPIFSIERTVEADGGLDPDDKKVLIQKLRRLLSHRTAFSTTMEVSHRELGKVEDIDGFDPLKTMRKSLDGGRIAMRFAVEGGMEELKASLLEEVYRRVELGRFGGVMTPGLERFKLELKNQFKLAEARLLAGEKVYAIGKIVMVESVVGASILQGKRKEEEQILGGGGAEAVSAFGRVMIPLAGQVPVRMDQGSGVAEFRRLPRLCWAVTGYPVSRTQEVGLAVDPKRPMEW